MASILIVDDSIIMRRNLKIILAQAGHDVVAEASNGKEAYTEYVKHKPDLVTMDITMPIMNGIDAVKKIISDFPAARIIMISALDQRNMVFEALENGAKHYIIKPITSDKVLTVLDAVIKETEEAMNEKSDDEYISRVERPIEAAIAKQIEDTPFEVENKDGEFIITLRDNLNIHTFLPLSTAVQGFMFIKPLTIAFNFDNMEKLDGDTLESLCEIISKIKSVNGIVKICDNKNIAIEYFKKMNVDFQVI